MKVNFLFLSSTIERIRGKMGGQARNQNRSLCDGVGFQVIWTKILLNEYFDTDQINEGPEIKMINVK